MAQGEMICRSFHFWNIRERYDFSKATEMWEQNGLAPSIESETKITWKINRPYGQMGEIQVLDLKFFLPFTEYWSRPGVQGSLVLLCPIDISGYISRDMQVD